MLIRRRTFSLIVPLLLASAGCSNALDMGYEVQFMFCFKANDLGSTETRISLIDPGDGGIRSGAVYPPMIKQIGASFVYPGSHLVHSGGAHYMSLEATKDHFLIWEFPVGRFIKSTDWTGWREPSFETTGEYAELSILRSTAKRLPAQSGNHIWFRYRIIKYDPFAQLGEIPLCPGDKG